MKKIIKNIKDFFKNDTKLAVLLIFCIYFIAFGLVVGFTRYDGEYFIKKSSEMSLKEFTIMRYQTWTSRNIIEIVSCIAIRWPSWLWAMVTSALYALISYSIIKMFITPNNKRLIWLACAFILIYPMYELHSSGWGIGTITYLWPLAMLFLSFIPIKKIYDNEKIKKYMYPIYTLALLYACNQEQSCFVAFAVYLFFTILHIINKPKKINKYLIFQNIIIILNIIFILTCPGNANRSDTEVADYFIDFNQLGIMDKATLGIVSTVNNLVVGKNVVFLAFSILIAFYICKNYSKCLYKIFSLIPVVSTIVFGFGKEIILDGFPHILIYVNIFENTNMLLTTKSYLDLINYVPVTISLIIIGSIILSLLLIFKKLRNNTALLIFLIGFASRAMMGFSPTVFASCERTFLFFDFALIIDCILIWQEYNKNQEKSLANKNVTALEIFYYFLAVVQYIDLLIFVLVNK